jgi:hypothetical protein
MVAVAKIPLWMQNADYPALTDRSFADLVYAVEGVLTGLEVTPNGGLNVAIAMGQAVVQGDEVPNQGKYIVDSDSVLNILLDPVGVTRTDYIYLLINDSAVVGGRAGDNATIEALSADPGDSAILLATIELPGGTATVTSGMITDQRSFTGVVIADGAVTAVQLADAAVGSDQIADGSVINVKLASGIDASKLTIGVLPIARIADGSVTDAKMASGQSATKLTTGTLPIARIADGSVTDAKMASGQSATKLTTGTLPIARIADGAVTAAKLETPIGGSSGTIAWERQGHWVCVYGSLTENTVASGVIPAAYRPDDTVHAGGRVMSGPYIGRAGTVTITTAGNVDTATEGGPGDGVGFCVVYPSHL